MRIQNNMPAMNTHRYYNIANNAVASSAEKLSSGYRINRAGDDAAGLAISEKMRAQIRGLNMASKNGSDAISLIQTAEGALQSTHNILQRMRELAVQSASDTNEQVIDRGALQQEFAALQAEIDDVATTTRFNDQNLLDGTFQKIRSTIDNPGTTLANVNATSVARAASGIYEMSVVNTPAQEAKVLDPGAQTEIFQDNLLGLAGSAAKVDQVEFDGLKTSDHNGNTYTVDVEGSDIKNMTFWLKDTNGDIVATAQNVDASGWQTGAGNKAANTVNFEGVGSFTFTLNDEITSVSDLTAMAGEKVTFIGEGPAYNHTMAIGDVADTNAELVKVGTAIESGLASASIAGKIKVDFAAGAAPVVIQSSSGAQKAFSLKVETASNGLVTASIVDADGNTIQSGTASGVGIAAGGNVKINLGDYGEMTITNTDTAVTAQKPAVPAGFGLSATDEAALDGNVSVTGAATKAGITGGISTITLASGDNNAAVRTKIEAALSNGTVTWKGTDDYDATGPSGTVDFTYTDTATGAKFDITIAGGANAATTTASLNTALATIAGKTVSAVAAVPEGATDVMETTNINIGLIDNNVANHGNAADAAVASTPVAVTGLAGGSEQVTQPASRSFMTLTINGESVNLYKGDTYANFNNQGIAFEFDALSDADIQNTKLFLGLEADIGAMGPQTVQISVNQNIGKDLVIQSGANEGDELAINIDRMSTETLGVEYSNIATREAASSAITEVNNAINKVSTQRAALGALQNRLDFKIANLDTSAENLQAAESRIRDVDMAKEMTAFSKKNILVQAATAMLAQANSAPQNVLQLLR